MTTKKYTVSECYIATFDLDVPADLEGDALADYIENERINGQHARTVDGVESVDWYETPQRYKQ